MPRASTVTRRAVLQAAVAGSFAWARWGRAAEAGVLHRYEEYGWLRGFSVVPSWAARIEEAWWRYDGQRFREEVALARSVHANCIRLWIEFTAWMAQPQAVTERFLDAVAAIDEQGMKTMPCLFNRWHDGRWDYGGQYRENLLADGTPQLEYVRALVEPLAADERILVWDLCNEPQAYRLDSELAQREYAWLEQVAATVRAAGARQPLTIGTMTGSNIETFAPLCDVLCGHPYAHTEEELIAQIETLTELRRRLGKPLLVNECLPGSLDDLRRAALIRVSTARLAAAGFGWMGWALREGQAISTRRDRYDANGLDGQGFHPFFTRDGTLRAGLEFLRERPHRRAPWEAS